MISVRRYDPEDQACWDAFVRNSKNGTFLFERSFMDYHSDRFVDHSLLCFNEDRLVALLPANLNQDGTVVSHGGLTYGGLVTDRTMTAALTLDVFQSVLSFLRTRGVTRLFYKPVPHIYHRLPAEEDLQALFLAGAQLVRSDLSSTIPLQNNPGFSKSKRAGVKAAVKAGLVAGESNDWSGFWHMLSATLSDRHDTKPTHSLVELELLAARFPQQVRLFTATRGSELFAGVVVFDCGPVVHAQYIASTQEGRKLGAIDSIIAQLVSEEFADRQWFDFGISTVDGGRELNIGLSRQKEMFGARSVVYQRFALSL